VPSLPKGSMLGNRMHELMWTRDDLPASSEGDEGRQDLLWAVHVVGVAKEQVVRMIDCVEKGRYPVQQRGNFEKAKEWESYNCEHLHRQKRFKKWSVAGRFNSCP